MKEWLIQHKGWVALCVVTWVLGLYMGWGRGPSTSHTHQHPGHPRATSQAPSSKKVLWTCSMHPQIKLPKKGKCPVCFMDLIPMTNEDDSNPRQLVLSQAGKALAQLRTHGVERRPVFLEVRLLGQVAYDETRIKSITAWVPGRLERLFVDYTGVPVRRGDHLVRIYSPELLAAQQELLQSRKAYQAAKRPGLVKKTAKMALASARRKLELLGLRGWQLQRILRQGKPSVRLNIYAPMGGIVIQKKAMEGMYVKTGTPIYTIADLSQVWIRFDAYERDLPWLRVGQEVSFSTQATPGRQFAGKVVYIDPMLNPRTRTVGVRVNAKNTDGALKPGMFVKGQVQVSVSADGRAQAPHREGKWVCPMHPEVVSKRRSTCRLCGMRLERIAAPDKGHTHDPLVIPSTAPLLTGKRAVVYVALPNKKKPTYEGRVVTLGPKAGDYYVVKEGLKEGEQVVTQGAFRLDSELQLRARPSMMSSQDKKAKNLAKKAKPIKANPALIKSLEPLYRVYFALQKALAGDKPKAARQAYRRLQQSLKRRLPAKGPARIAWEKLRSLLYDATKQGLKHKALKGQRTAFLHLSRALIQLEQTLGHAGMKKLHLAYCPMAFDNKGAYWLQQKKAILNPYFGHKMLVCGSIKRSFVGVDGRPVKAPRAFLNKLSPLYEAYLSLQDGLFKDQFKQSLQAAKRLARLAKRPRHRGLKRRLRARWRVLAKALRQDSAKATKTKDIEALRRSFEDISKVMLRMAYIFGHNRDKALFEAYCPMAFNNKGAAWLQAQDRRVHNAYFGAKMAYCGTIRRRFDKRK